MGSGGVKLALLDPMKAEDLTANRSVFDLQAAAELRLKIKQDPQARVKLAAQQFETLLLQTMLKSMRDATPQDGMMDSDQTRLYTSMLDQQLAQNLSASGKLGFAKLIEQQLMHSQSGASSLDPAATLEALQKGLAAAPAASTATAATAAASAGAERIRTTAVRADGSAAPAGAASSASEFVSRIWPYAVEAGSRIGVPAQFVVAHSALESAWGKSEIRATDGSPSYNLFGVKAGRGWRGATVDVATTEYVGGVAQSTAEKFRVYGSYTEAFNDYTSLLRNNPRFSTVLGQQDGSRFATSLQQSGYATDPAYADKLSRLINSAVLREALAG